MINKFRINRDTTDKPNLESFAETQLKIKRDDPFMKKATTCLGCIYCNIYSSSEIYCKRNNKYISYSVLLGEWSNCGYKSSGMVIL